MDREACEKQQAAPAAGPKSGRGLFTIGHSNHTLARLIELLQQAGVTAVADVRSMPFSQRHPQFNRPELEAGLRQQGMAYLHLGDALGGRPADSDLYDHAGRADYERMRMTQTFSRGLVRLVGVLQKYRVALLCAEEDPLDCHRGLMIGPALLERGIAANHLRADGSQETTAVFEERLLAATGVGAGILDGLFAAAVSAEERGGLLAEAYRAQARRKAYRVRPGDPSPGEELDETS
jgi:hypothetical protein